MKTDGEFKKFAVIGAGPVGSIVAAFLARGAYDVTLCDVVAPLVEAARSPGITIDGAEDKAGEGSTAPRDALRHAVSSFGIVVYKVAMLAPSEYLRRFGIMRVLSRMPQ